jgi:hypothetical protein
MLAFFGEQDQDLVPRRAKPDAEPPPPSSMHRAAVAGPSPEMAKPFNDLSPIGGFKDLLETPVRWAIVLLALLALVVVVLPGVWIDAGKNRLRSFLVFLRTP